MNPLLIGLLAIGAYALVKQTAETVDTISVIPQKIKFATQSGIFSLVLQYEFLIENRGNSQVQIKAVDGVIIDGSEKQIATFLTNEPFTIAPRSTVKVNARVRVDNILALQSLYQSWLLGKTPQVNIKGGLQTELGRIPFTYNLLISRDFNLKKKES